MGDNGAGEERAEALKKRPHFSVENQVLEDGVGPVKNQSLYGVENLNSRFCSVFNALSFGVKHEALCPEVSGDRNPPLQRCHFRRF